ncbi:MAG TPA: hypothetical protein VIS06_17405 [Mycobacteriales bacterium]
MALAVPQQWTGTGGRADVRVAAQPAEGSWLIATIAYRTVDGTQALASVADMGRNWWILCGSAYNEVTGTRVEVWACPTVAFAGFPLASVYSAVSHIHADDTGSHVVHVAEVTGFVNGFPTLLGTAVATATGTTLSVALADPGATALIIAAAAADNNDVTITAPGAPWTALTPVTRDGPDLSLTPVWQAGTGTQTATWTSTSPLVWTGVIIALAETGTVWDQPNANWPATRLEVAAGYGQDVPLTRIPAADWVDQTSRFEAFGGAARGIGYELGRPQAGAAGLTLRNYDDAITSVAGGAYDLYTPYRILTAWDGKIYPVSAGWLEEAVRQWRTAHHGYVDWSVVDALATLAQDVPSALRGDILRRQPYAYWPLDDPSGALVAANASPRSSAALQVTQSKYGVAAATQDFGAATELDGDAGTGWQQQGLTNVDNVPGFALVGADPGFPAVSGGVTVFGITRVADDLNTQPDGGVTLCILRSDDARNNTVIKVWMTADLGIPTVTVWDKDTAAATNTAGTFNIAQMKPIPWVLRFNRTSWRLAHQRSNITFSGACDLPDSFRSISIGGEADEVYNGNAGNAVHSHIAVWDRELTDGEVVQLMDRATVGYRAGESIGLRAQRYMATGGARLPRAVDASTLTGSRDTQNGVLLQRLADLADQDTGLLYGDAAGNMRFRSGSAGYQQAARWTFGEDTAAGEIPFAPAVRITSGPTYLYNRVNVANTGEAGRDESPLVWSDRTHLAVDAASGGRYGIRPLDRATNLYYTAEAQHLAEWLLAQYREPTQRFAEVTVNAAAYPAAWPMLLAVEVGDLVNVVRRPVGQAEIRASCRVLQVKPTLRYGLTGTEGSVTLTLAAAPPPVLVLGDPAKGVLGDTTIGWA